MAGHTLSNSEFFAGSTFMTTTKNTVSDLLSKEHRRNAQIALTLTPPDQAEACPTEAELAACIDQRLAPEDRERLLHHIANCPRCYATWLETSRAIQQQDQAHQRIVTARTRRWALVGMAAAVCLALTVWFTRPFWAPADLPRLLAGTYERLSHATNATTRTELAHQPFPWETPQGYALASTAPTPASQAFAAGLVQGRAELTGDDGPELPDAFRPPHSLGATWEKTQWAPYQALGRWVVAARAGALCHDVQSSLFWDDLRQSSSLLRRQLVERPAADPDARQTATALSRLAAMLDRFGMDGMTDRQQTQFLYALDHLVFQLAPAGIAP